MSYYLLLSRLNEEGLRMVRESPSRMREVKTVVERKGGRLIAHYALLGSYDFAMIVEAADPETIARISAEIGALGVGQSNTLGAIEIEDFIRSLTRS